MYAGDTIAAIATAPGRGGVGIVRVSGPAAVPIGAAVFARAESAPDWQSHRFYHGHLVDHAGQILDEGLAVLMRAPHSYTTEDVLELHCHGSPVLLRAILGCVLTRGARLAEPGEFTRRAFLNGRMDLPQSEAVLDIVRARTSAAAALAVGHLSGTLSQRLTVLRDELIGLKASLETQIDFSEDEIDIRSSDLIAACDRCRMVITELLNSYRRGKALRDGIRLAIVGKPNVGKSSLLNALLGEDRAIVSELAGTTRDSIDEAVDFDGVPVVLSDTAGLRVQATDAVEHIGMQRTAAKIEQADVVLIVIDASMPTGPEDRQVVELARKHRCAIVLNKSDLESRIAPEDEVWLGGLGPMTKISATERWGLTELRHAVLAMIDVGLDAGDGPVLTNLRHHDLLNKARVSLEWARQSLSESRAPELVAVDVQDTLDRIGELTGTISREDVLDRVFSQFCIGK